MRSSLRTTRSFLVRVFEGSVRRLPYGRGALDAVAPERSTEVLTRTNTLPAYDRVYDSDRLLEAYLGRGRLEFYEELATIFAPLAPRSTIDIGCGTGHLLGLTVDRMGVPPERVVGVDHSEAGIRRARKVLPSATWIVADLFELTFEERFDLVICTEVLEHLDEPARAVERLRGLCGPGGRVAITVPDGAQDDWEGHVNFWDEDALRAFLAPSGLTAIQRIEGGRVLLAWLLPGP
jgi:2-polyprenyl-3-methyl-5-hydroxy-6-metoxy-1,4-benzoquinol methylase